MKHLLSPEDFAHLPQQAVDLFEQGYSCAQAIAIAFAPALGLEKDQAARISTAFGAGGCGRAGTCGAISGALMVIGLAHGRVRADDKAARDRTYELGNKLMAEFEKRYGSTECREILGVDISDPSGNQRATDEGLFQTVCAGLVGDVAKQLTRAL